MSQTSVTLEDVQVASRTIESYVHRTPVVTSSTFDDWCGKSLFFKCENLQRVGAFKFRGACNALLNIPSNLLESGVVTHSSGNHAQALSLAAKMLGVPAFIVMPEDAPEAKQAAVEGYGGQIFECESNLAAREAVASQIQGDTGAIFVSPYDDPNIIAGQGTAALELIDQIADLDAIIAPVGGGGLISGVCAVARNLDRPLRVFAAEPKGADDAAQSKACGERITEHVPDTIADGLLTTLGELTWPFVRDHVEQVITVSDQEIIQATRLFWQRCKLVIEPSAGVAVAAAMSDQFAKIPEIRRVGIILSGGNLDLDRLEWMSNCDV